MNAINTVILWIRNSALNRFFLFCARLWETWSGWYHKSAVCGAVTFFQNQYGTSRLCKLVTRALTRNNCSAATENSIWNRLLLRLHMTCISAGEALGRAWDASAVAKPCAAISRYWHKSKIGARLADFGMKRLIIVAFAFYLPIDFAFREIIGIELLASVWDDAFLLFALMYAVYLRGKRGGGVIPMNGKRPAFTFSTPVDIFLIVFFAAHIFLMLAVSPYMDIAFAGWRAVCQYALWFFVLIRLVENDRDFQTFFMGFTAMGVLLALYGCAQFVIGVQIPESWVTQTEQGVRTRVFGLTSSPNIMGALMVMSAPLAASYAYRSKELWQRVLAWGCAGTILLACLFTFSRGAWGGMAVAVVLFAMLVDRRLIAMMVAAIPVVFAVPSIANRILFLFTSDYAAASAVGGRAVRWETGMNFFRRDPALGFGLGRFGGAVAMQNQVESNVNGFSYFYMDNYYLKLLVEGGIVSLAVFVAVLLVILLTGTRTSYKLRKTSLGPQAAALIAGMGGVMLHLYTENIFEVPYMNAYFWGFAAMLAWLGFVRPRFYANNKNKTD